MTKKAIIAFALLHASTPMLIYVSGILHDDGAAKVMAYQWGDWLILGLGAIALMFSNLLSFFSTKWSEYKSAKNGDTGIWKRQTPNGSGTPGSAAASLPSGGG